ncbi:hypothetical protein PUMCH_004457 [Australozyma saopauloensis]|uniref:Postreplication repair E3 ubiquitin-protein ligase RAD18 n=1 Tax=Australozyma saopauloensis TaxID=291208 RepID=A0AAX4HET8_9ASCO|nr:hypothetical protein PUMCH_004457 [[Candida] saopauloensis]
MASSDPSEWLQTRLPKLSQLDSLQRCLICKDFLKAPVITSCNHTFCSLCIRQHLQSVSNCPLCKAEQFESNLKRVIILEELVSCFRELRPQLLSLLALQDSGEAVMEPPPPKDIEVVEISDDDTSKGPDLVQCPVCSKSMSAKHLQQSHLDYCLRGEVEPPAASALLKLTRSAKSSAERKRGGISLFFLAQKRARPSPPPKEEINHEAFYFNEVHKHHHEVKRLPKIDFSSLSTVKVKEKLLNLKLLTQGTRPQLELRYNQFYLLYNSNIDLSRPASELELRQKLNQWEKSHQGFSAPKAGSTIYGDELKYKALTDKDFPIRGWLKKYREEFTTLTQTARATHAKKKASAIDVPSGTTTPESTTQSPGMTTSTQLQSSTVAVNEVIELSSHELEKQFFPDSKQDANVAAASSADEKPHFAATESLSPARSLAYLGNAAPDSALQREGSQKIAEEELYDFSNSMLA